MKRSRRSALATAFAILALSAPAPAGADKAPYETSEIRWKASESGFSSWTVAGGVFVGQSYLFSVAVP